jgi:CBS domain-containing protein
MGEQHISTDSDESTQRGFVRAVLDDLEALELMLDKGMIESGIRRIGAELEMFLIDKNQHPAPVAMEVLEGLNPAMYTTELAKFNLEVNATPREFGGDCLGEFEAELNKMVAVVRGRAAKQEAEILLTGILPTLQLSDITLDNMAPMPRYFALNKAMVALRGGKFHVNIKGLDELDITHDNVMLESCNTGFQIHFQVGPEEFPRLYNQAQVVTAPVLAAGVFSPTMLERRLWSETRVALFEQSIDSRSSAQVSRGARPRVSFGDRWIKDSVLEIFREDISRFRVVLSTDHDQNPVETVQNGVAPSLKALMLHNGTVYRWNRACYGVHEGVAHLRVENRVLPAGPTMLDQMANAAFFFGLMAVFGDEYGDVSEKMPFEDAKSNFFAAAQHGLQAQFNWFGEKAISASELILDELLPLARHGLNERKIATKDINRYLGVLEKRVMTQRTGAKWFSMSLAGMGNKGTSHARFQKLTAVMVELQKKDQPVHEWDLATYDDSEDWSKSYRTIGQIMTREVFTVGPEDLVDLAASVMEWEHIRHIPVEDDRGKLVGLLSHRELLRLVGRGHGAAVSAIPDGPVAIKDLMQKEIVTCTPETTTLEALSIMRTQKVRCLPVIDEEEQLVGIVTDRDFLDVAARLMENELKRRESRE